MQLDRREHHFLGLLLEHGSSIAVGSAVGLELFRRGLVEIVRKGDEHQHCADRSTAGLVVFSRATPQAQAIVPEMARVTHCQQRTMGLIHRRVADSLRAAKNAQGGIRSTGSLSF
jgi:hypothetical protein